MRRFALAGLLIAALAPLVFANGRPPGTSTIHFQEGHEQNVVAGMTFGLVISHDGGTTWHWMCETAVGYGGLWDPDYTYLQGGTLFATTFSGLKSMTDGCTFNSTTFGNLFVSTDEGRGSAFLFGAADPSDDKVYKSSNEGSTFPTSTTPAGALVNDWYTSLMFAPSDPTKVYLAGYRFNSSNQKILLLYKSIDGGGTFTAMGQTGLPTTPASSSAIDIVGIDPTNPSILYVRVTYANGSLGDTIYKSTNAGQSWTTLRSKADTISFLVRSNGDLVIGTRSLGAEVSNNGGTSWTPLNSAPKINCLVENAAHEVWACTQNYDVMSGSGSDTIPGDGFGIMKSTNLTTWTGVLKYQDIQGPVMCAAGTPQHDTCAQMNWCGLRMQLGITATGGIDCSAVGVDGAPDGGSGTHVPPTTPPKGCCDTGVGSAPPLAMGLVVGVGLLRRRRKSS
ncbi:MAG: hypothetical protein JO257_08905 [Deltaproteobacteria bacterium]|nr:hypothetical protein [Deltaproteobacteria bacterium]